MGLNIGKYRFNSKEQAESKIEGLGIEQDENGNNYPTHKHTITKLGYEVLEEAVYDEADKRGVPTVYWLTQDFNKPARLLYDKIATLTPFIKYNR